MNSKNEVIQTNNNVSDETSGHADVTSNTTSTTSQSCHVSSSGIPTSLTTTVVNSVYTEPVDTPLPTYKPSEVLLSTSTSSKYPHATTNRSIEKHSYTTHSEHITPRLRSPRRRSRLISEMTVEEVDATLLNDKQFLESPFYSNYEPKEVLGR